jgi:hypothetical protein
MKNLQSFGVQELNTNEIRNTNGGILPAIVLWWAGATLLTKIGVIAGGATVVGGAAALGYYNGYNDAN